MTTASKAAWTGIVLGAMLAAVAWGQSFPSSTTSRILAGLAVEEARVLNFGDVAPGGGGAVTVSPTSALTTASTAPADPLVPMGGTVTAGRFRVFDIARKGTRKFTFTVVDASILLSVAGGSGPDYEMVVDTFTSDAVPCNPCNRTQPNAFEAFIHVGATLHVKATQAPGIYQGTYTVRIDEQ